MLLRAPAIGLGLALTLAALAFVPGCDQPTGAAKKRAAVAPVEAPAEPAAPEPAVATTPPPPVVNRPILGEKTQDVRDAKAEARAGGVETAPRITAKDPILLVGNAYVSTIGRAAMLNIQHAVDLYKAETGEFPKNLDEFMEKIIKANNIALPKLPAYQDYAYDADKHGLVIMEYPDRKEAMNYPK